MDNIITLTNEFGSEERYEFLDLIHFSGKEYVVLLPVDPEDGEVTILSVEDSNEDQESYVSVDDEETLMAVFNIFKDKWKDEFDFVEE